MWLVVALLLSLSVRVAEAGAVNSCNLFAFTGVAEFQLNTMRFLNTGDVIRPNFSFGADGITGGSKGIVDRVRWDLNCLTQGLPCVPAEALVVYDGDSTITSTCPGITWHSNGSGNEITFTATPPLELPGSTPAVCKMAFNAHVAKLPSDGSQSVITVGGFRAGDAHCDNGLASLWTDPLPVWELCPTCKGGAVCNQQTGVCEPGPTPTPSTTHWQCDVCRQVP